MYGMSPKRKNNELTRRITAYVSEDTYGLMQTCVIGYMTTTDASSSYGIPSQIVDSAVNMYCNNIIDKEESKYVVCDEEC